MAIKGKEQRIAKRRKKGDERALVLALAQGFTVEQAAAKADFGVRTVYRRRAKPAFQQQVRQARAEMVERQAGQLTMLSFGSIKVLGEGQQDAAEPLAERWRIALQVLNQSRKFREEGDVLQRLQKVEEAQGIVSHNQSAGPTPQEPRGSKSRRAA